MNTIECLSCSMLFDGHRYRFRCPQCGLKASCCEGEPQACNPS